MSKTYRVTQPEPEPSKRYATCRYVQNYTERGSARFCDHPASTYRMTPETHSEMVYMYACAAHMRNMYSNSEDFILSGLAPYEFNWHLSVKNTSTHHSSRSHPSTGPYPNPL